jgi:hypothetical protein
MKKLPCALALLLFTGCTDKPKAEEHAAHGGHAHGAVPAGGSAATKGGESAGQRVFFVFPQDGSKVLSPVSLAFGVSGMTVTPAGQHMEDRQRGHHHVIIDGEPVAAGAAVPADERHLHFGKGETATALPLAPGKHTLTLQFADGAHISYGPALSQTITVEVTEPAAEGKPRVFFKDLADGAKVKSPVKLQFGVEGMTLRPAGQDPLDKTTGHHHVIVDGAAMPTGTAVPADERHIHYGLAQTEAELALSPGKHTLTLQLADGAHVSYGEALSATVSVEVLP